MPDSNYVDKLRAVTAYATDALGRVYQSTQYSVSQTMASTAATGMTTTASGVDTEVTSTLFDKMSNVVLVSIPDPGSSAWWPTTWTFDGAGRELSETDPDPDPGRGDRSWFLCHQLRLQRQHGDRHHAVAQLVRHDRHREHLRRRRPVDRNRLSRSDGSGGNPAPKTSMPMTMGLGFDRDRHLHQRQHLRQRHDLRA